MPARLRLITFVTLIYFHRLVLISSFCFISFYTGQLTDSLKPLTFVKHWSKLATHRQTDRQMDIDIT